VGDTCTRVVEELRHGKITRCAGHDVQCVDALQSLLFNKRVTNIARRREADSYGRIF